MSRAVERRLVEFGLPESVLETTTDRIASWTAWARAWYEAADEHAAAGDGRASVAALLAAGYYDADPLRRARRAAMLADRYRALEHAAPLESIEIYARERPVRAVLQRPRASEGEGVLPCALLFPGLGARIEDAHFLAEALLHHGVAVCRVDTPGCDPAGLPIDGRSAADAADMARSLARDKRVDPTRIATVGTCLGGLFAAAATAEGRAVSAHLISTPVNVAQLVERSPTSIVNGMLFATRALTPPAALEVARRAGVGAVLNRTRAPLTVHVGDADRIVMAADAERIRVLTPSAVTVRTWPDEHACPAHSHEIARLVACGI